MQEIMQFAGKHPMLSLAWVALLVLVVVFTVKNLFSGVKSVSRIEATQLINQENAVFVDTRSRDDYRKGHIFGSINIQAAEIKKGNFGELEKHKTQPIIVVCAMGNTAFESASQLNAAGFTSVSVLKEGIAGWNGENLPLVRGK